MAEAFGKLNKLVNENSKIVCDYSPIKSEGKRRIESIFKSKLTISDPYEDGEYKIVKSSNVGTSRETSPNKKMIESFSVNL